MVEYRRVENVRTFCSFREIFEIDQEFIHEEEMEFYEDFT